MPEIDWRTIQNAENELSDIKKKVPNLEAQYILIQERLSVYKEILQLHEDAMRETIIRLEEKGVKVYTSK
jgi:hypothetical protein